MCEREEYAGGGDCSNHDEMHGTECENDVGEEGKAGNSERFRKFRQ